MAITVFLSGGATNAFQELSIGGVMSNVIAPQMIFGRISNASYLSGKTIYRCVYVKTTLAATLKAFIKADTGANTTQIAVGWGAAAANGTETAVANENTAPAGVTFSTATTLGSAVSSGALTANSTKALWYRLVIQASEPLDGEQFQIAIDDGIAESITGVGTASGVATATAVGVSGNPSAVVGTSSGQAVALAVGGRISRAVGAATGVAAATATGSTAAWTPAAEAGLIAWFDMTTPSSYNSGTRTWTARWGGKTAVGAVGGPSVLSNAFDGTKGALQFVGTSNQTLTMASPGAQEMVTLVVLKFTTLNGVTPNIWTRAQLGIGVAGLLSFDFGGLRAQYVTGNAADDYAATVTTGGIAVSRHTLAARTVRWNGTETATNTTVQSGTQPATNDSFNIFYYPSSQDFTVQVAAVGVFQGSAWSTALAEKIEGFVAHNGIGVGTSVLPSGHTYKSVAP